MNPSDQDEQYITITIELSFSNYHFIRQLFLKEEKIEEKKVSISRFFLGHIFFQKNKILRNIFLT